MNFQFYVEKLKALEKYPDFLKEFPRAYPCSGFFVFDKTGEDNKQHFDFFLPKDDKIVSFQLESGNFAPVDMIGEEKLEKIDLDLEFDFNDVESIIEKEKISRGIKNKIQKFLFSLQRKNGKHFLVGTVFISGLGMIKVSVDLKEMKIEDFEKKSFFDIMKVKKGKKKD